MAKDLIRSLEVNSQDEVKAEVDEATTTATTTEEVATTSIINA